MLSESETKHIERYQQAQRYQQALRAAKEFKQEMKLKDYVDTTDIGPILVKGVLIVTGLLEFKPNIKPQVSHLIETLCVFVSHFGDQDTPCLEFGTDCISVSRAKFTSTTERTLVNCYVTITTI
jgi:hypothetical protein